MATLALAAAGAAAGSALLPTGIGVLGVTLSGAALGSQVGALAGSYVDQMLFGASGGGRQVEGPRLRELHVTTSTEGAPIQRVCGRTRIGGQVIWATDFEEVARTDTQTAGGGKGAPAAGGVERTDYSYYANFAVALCEGEVSGLERVWADGEEIDISRFTYRFYRGVEDQLPDSLIASVEGNESAPGFRGVCYIVFERMPLADFGNRIPQLSFEVVRVVADEIHGLKSVVVIPGSGEFVYGTQEVSRQTAPGVSVSENRHSRVRGTDWSVSMDQLQMNLPDLKHVSLVVSWFGDDLRAGECRVRPGVERREKTTTPYAWAVGDARRESAYVVSQIEGRPAYGGTPADRAVLEAIRDCAERGISVTFNPFILMDIPSANGLPDPYGGGEQAVYPWRGRITCHPAPGVSGSPDMTVAAGDQVRTFMGTVTPDDFAIDGDELVYTGPAEWSYRRFILHYAWLAKLAGGVESFLLGSELRGLSWIREGAGAYPFVAELVAIAADVKSVLGGQTKVSYAADWSEYFGHQPGDGSGDVYFHLDAFWADENVDAVAIDNYWPLSDWRDGRNHLDAQAGHGLYDTDYLMANIFGGEGFDWYYASQEDREAQIRTPITDGAGKPWVFRFKDLRGWWSSQHFHRPGGIESVVPTAWVPESKPVWFTEIGCPAVDKGTNQPNVFVDPKSAETALPYFSSGSNDTVLQRQYYRAMVSFFSDATQPGLDVRNPVSNLTGARMVDPDRLYAYCWDARPYPAFPADLETWGDGQNWEYGHWLNGRLSQSGVAQVVGDVVRRSSFSRHVVEDLVGLVPGYVIDRVMSAREALQPLGLAYFFDAVETGAEITFRQRGQQTPVAELEWDQLVEVEAKSPLSVKTRGQESELPGSAKLSYIRAEASYGAAVAESRRLSGASARVAQAELPVVLSDVHARQIAESWLHETWVARDRITFELPPSRLELEPGDVVSLRDDAGDAATPYRITEIADHGSRTVEARRFDPEVYDGIGGGGRPWQPAGPILTGAPYVVALDLPLLTGEEDESQGYVAGHQEPWPGRLAIYSSPETTGFEFAGQATQPATMGRCMSALGPGVAGRPDYSQDLIVEVRGGLLASATQIQVFAGRNSAALRHDDGQWEVVQFLEAELVSDGVYRLRGLLRGQAGTDFLVVEEAAGISADAAFVVLNGALVPVSVSQDTFGLPLNWRVGPAVRGLDDETYVGFEHAFMGVGWRPYAPVHVRAKRESDRICLSWKRRTRVGGDSWRDQEVPLSENTELYDVLIRNGESVVRTLTTSEPFVDYPNADEIADFGFFNSSLSVSVHQKNAVWGRGSGFVRSIPVE